MPGVGRRAFLPEKKPVSTKLINEKLTKIEIACVVLV